MMIQKFLRIRFLNTNQEIDIIDLQLKQINKDRRDLSEGKLLIKNSKEFKNNKYDQLDIEDPNLSVLKEFDELNQKIYPKLGSFLNLILELLLLWKINYYSLNQKL